MGRPVNKPISTVSETSDGGDTGGGGTHVLQDERLIYLNSDVEEDSVGVAVANLFQMFNKDPLKPITLIINTYGGSIDEMLALYDTMKYVQHTGGKIHTIGLGKIMSAGVLVLAAGTKGHRKIGRNARVMYHAGAYSLADGVALDSMENNIKEYKRLEELCNVLFADETNLSLEEVNKMLENKLDIYMTPETAIQHSIVDGYLGE